MALDHYVPQVHLRNFYSPDLDGTRLFAIRKHDGKRFEPRSQDVCRIENGNSNSYLEEPRHVEEVLRTVEPYYNQAVEAIRTGRISDSTVYIISGYIACLHACSPTTMRLNNSPTERMIAATIEILDAQGLLPQVPENKLTLRTATELIKFGAAEIVVDPKYPQAVSLSSVFRHISMIGNLRWEIIHNSHVGASFFSSDFPSAIEMNSRGKLSSRIYPLAPDLAIRLLLPGTRRRYEDLKFSDFQWRKLYPPRAEVVSINRQLIKCAEEHVFFRDNEPWIPHYVKKYSQYNIQGTASNTRTDLGILVSSRHEITERTA